MTTIIHVNRQNIAFNAKHGKSILPPYTVKVGKRGKARYGFGVAITGPSEMIDPRTRNPLSCGARAWIETDSEVIITDEMTWQDVVEIKSLHQKMSSDDKGFLAES